MKIAIAGGHSKAAPGTSGYLDEYECDRAYVAQLIPVLRAAGFEVVDCTNEAATSNAELAEEVRIANGSGADVFLAIHFNSGIGKDTDETTGTECFYVDGNAEGRRLAAALSANVAAALRVKDRGAKTAKFYVLRNTKMTALLLEVCFVDDKDDAARWAVTSWEALTSAVVRAFGGSVAQAPATPEPEKPTTSRPTPSAEKDGGFGGPYRCRVDGLRIRTEPRLGDEYIVRRSDGSESSYNKGESVNLDDKYYIADGYVWGTYIGNSGNRRYIAVGRATGKPEPDDFLIKI